MEIPELIQHGNEERIRNYLARLRIGDSVNIFNGNRRHPVRGGVFLVYQIDQTLGGFYEVKFARRCGKFDTISLMNRLPGFETITIRDKDEDTRILDNQIQTDFYNHLSQYSDRVIETEIDVRKWELIKYLTSEGSKVVNLTW